MDEVFIDCPECLERGGFTDASVECPVCGGRPFVPVTDELMRQAGGWLVATVFRCASWSQKGVLPAAGGLMDQPAWLIDAVEVLWMFQGQQRLRELESTRNG